MTEEETAKKKTKILLKGDGCHNCKFAEEVRIFNTEKFHPDKLVCTLSSHALPKYVSKSKDWCTEWEALEVDSETLKAYKQFRKELKEKYGR